ncbi:MAG: hypothetical protein ACOC5L_04715 [Halobacteriota archaeon]
MKKILVIVIALVIVGCSSETVEDGGNQTPVSTTTTTPQEKMDTPETIKLLVFEAHVEVIDKGQPPHIVSSKDKLDFGKLPQGMTEEKEVLLTNNRDYNITGHSKANGTIAQFISFERDSITVPPKSNCKQLVYLRAPLNAQTGNYSGFVTFYFTK